MIDSERQKWVACAAGATAYPTDGQGGATATATSSSLHLARAVVVYGILLSALDNTVTVEVVDSAGTAIPGLAITPGGATTTRSMFMAFGPNGLRYSHATNANVGLKCNGTNAGILIYEKVA